MTEPVTELTLEAPAGLIRVRAECARRQGHGGHVPQRAGLRDAHRRPGRGPARSARSRSTSPTAACSTSSPTRAGSASGSRPDEGADIVRITEMIKAAANEQLPVVHPDQPGFAGITIGQLSGPPHDPANSRRNVVTVSTGTLDWDRPATWTGAIDRSPCGTGHVGPDGDAPRPWRAGRRRRRSVTRASSARCSPVGWSRRPPSGRTGRSSRRSAARPGSPASRPTSSIPTDPFPDGFTVGDIWG